MSGKSNHQRSSKDEDDKFHQKSKHDKSQHSSMNYSAQVGSSNQVPRAVELGKGKSAPVKVDYRSVSDIAYKMSQTTPIPPFANVDPSSESLKEEHMKRNRRRSKFSREQDEMIINMKRAGKSWVDIADAAGVGSYLAARNRYQVLIGQQGGANSDSGPEDVETLREILDEGETEKWQYLAKQYSQARGQQAPPRQLREFIRYLFWKNPGMFDVDEKYLTELMKQQGQHSSSSYPPQQLQQSLQQFLNQRYPGGQQQLQQQQQQQRQHQQIYQSGSSLQQEQESFHHHKKRQQGQEHIGNENREHKSTNNQERKNGER